MSSDQETQPASENQTVQAVAAEQRDVQATSYVQALREKAAKITNKQEREEVIREAYEKEVETHGNSKLAKRLQSGTWQGGVAGGGIGLGTGVGVGTVLGTTVGTLVGGVVSIPTTGLGILVGAGVGAAHGPWFKLNGKSKRSEDAPLGEKAVTMEQEQSEQAEGLVRQDGMAADGRVDRLPERAEPGDPIIYSKRKPRKIEIRSSPARDELSPATPEAVGVEADQPRKPKKLAARSKSVVHAASKST